MKTKEERKNNIISNINEDIVSNDETSLRNEFAFNENYKNIIQLINDLNKHNDQKSNLQRKFEIFCLKYERSLIPINDLNHIEKFLAKVFYTNKTFCIHFDDPIIIGSFSGNCVSANNKVIDILLSHKLDFKNFPYSVDILIKNFKNIICEFNVESDVKVHNKIDEINLDLEFVFQDRDYSFNLLLREYEKNKKFIEYIKTHNELNTKEFKEPIQNFNILKRLFRSWRRKFELFFITPELLDWVIVYYCKNSIAESVIFLTKKIRLPKFLVKFLKTTQICLNLLYPYPLLF